MRIYLELDKDKVIICKGYQTFEMQKNNVMVKAELVSDTAELGKRFIKGKVVDNLLPSEEAVKEKIASIQTLHKNQEFRTFVFNTNDKKLNILVNGELSTLFLKRIEANESWTFEADEAEVDLTKEEILGYFKIIEDVLAIRWGARKETLKKVKAIQNVSELEKYDTSILLLQSKADTILKYDFLS
jgi:hypothetical protein